MLTTVTKELLVLQHGDAGRAPTRLQNSQIYAHHEHQHQLHLPLRAARMRV